MHAPLELDANGSIDTLESFAAPTAMGLGVTAPPSTIAVILPSVELEAAANRVAAVARVHRSVSAFWCCDRTSR